MPKMVEISEEDFLANQSLRNTVAKLRSDPKAWALVEQAAKVVDPNVKTPTIDAQTAANEPIAALRKEMQDFMAAQTKERTDRETADKLAALERNKTAGIAKLRAEGWTDEGIKGVEKIMEEKGILDPIDAAAVFEKHHPPAIPVTPASAGSWNFMALADDTSADIKKLVESKGESEQLVQKMAIDALNDIRGASRR